MAPRITLFHLKPRRAASCSSSQEQEIITLPRGGKTERKLISFLLLEFQRKFRIVTPGRTGKKTGRKNLLVRRWGITRALRAAGLGAKHRARAEERLGWDTGWAACRTGPYAACATRGAAGSAVCGLRPPGGRQRPGCFWPCVLRRKPEVVSMRVNNRHGQTVPDPSELYPGFAPLIPVHFSSQVMPPGCFFHLHASIFPLLQRSQRCVPCCHPTAPIAAPILLNRPCTDLQHHAEIRGLWDE